MKRKLELEELLKIQSGVDYLGGKGVKRNLTKAIELLKDTPDGQFFLGASFHGHHKANKDLKKALYWYEKAASNGHGQAQYNLALMYANKDGVDRNLMKAYHWISKAAENNIDDAKETKEQILNDLSIEELEELYKPKSIPSEILLQYKNVGQKELMIQNRGDIEMTKKEKIKLNKVSFFGRKNLEAFYEGEVVDGQPHGKGKLTYEKFKEHKFQIFFEGTFKEGRPINGKLHEWDGSIYEGEFELSAEYGHGKITYKDGQEYHGEWQRTDRMGEGSMVFLSNGSEFHGHWHDDHPSDGQMIFPDGTTFDGTFHQLSFEFARGVITYIDGRKFEGWFDDDEKRDKFEGTMTYPNGDVIKGSLHIANVNKYEGMITLYEAIPSDKDKFVPNE